MLGWFGRSDINEGVKEYGATPGALLVDVRTAEEYADGHIAGSVNLPLGNLDAISHLVREETPLFVYCYSGARSGSAVAAFRRMGYTSVRNIGGIASWRGPVTKGTGA